MRYARLGIPWFAGLCLAACAGAPDRFYTLSTLPEPAKAARPAPTLHVRLNVTVPSLVDRSEMVLNSSASGITIFDHERWAAPLADQVSQTLGLDMEERRRDLLVGDRRFDQASLPAVAVKVDIVRMSARSGGDASIEAHWRIVDAGAGMDRLGSATFSAPLAGDGFGAVARAYSETVSALADALVANLRP